MGGTLLVPSLCYGTRKSGCAVHQRPPGKPVPRLRAEMGQIKGPASSLTETGRLVGRMHPHGDAGPAGAGPEQPPEGSIHRGPQCSQPLPSWPPPQVWPAPGTWPWAETANCSRGSCTGLQDRTVPPAASNAPLSTIPAEGALATLEFSQANTPRSCLYQRLIKMVRS